MTIEHNKLKNIIEAAMFSMAQPMSIDQLLKLFDEDDRPSANLVKEVIQQLQADCDGRGIELKEIASGYRYQSRQDFSQWLSRLWEERPAKYSRAALETLALIAYRQPVTRAEIEDVRGVGVSSSIIKTMLEREWIRVIGHRDVPGRPALYATTKQFLDYFNMKNLQELPSLAEIRDLEDINPELDLPNPDDERDVSKTTDDNVEGDTQNQQNLLGSEDEYSSEIEVKTETVNGTIEDESVVENVDTDDSSDAINSDETNGSKNILDSAHNEDIEETIEQFSPSNESFYEELESSPDPDEEQSSYNSGSTDEEKG